MLPNSTASLGSTSQRQLRFIFSGIQSFIFIYLSIYLPTYVSCYCLVCVTQLVQGSDCWFTAEANQGICILPHLHPDNSLPPHSISTSLNTDSPLSANPTSVHLLISAFFSLPVLRYFGSSLMLPNPLRFPTFCHDVFESAQLCSMGSLVHFTLQPFCYPSSTSTHREAPTPL